MHFRVAHETVYRYDLPVMLGPHLVRLSPRREGVRLHDERLDVEPQPVELREEADSSGNRVTRMSFAGETMLLSMTSGFDLDTDMPAPLVGLPDPLPWMAAADGLDACRSFSSGSIVRAYAEQVASAVGHARSPSSTDWPRTSACAPISASAPRAMHARRKKRLHCARVPAAT